MLNKKDILGGVYGLAIGDALGVPVEFSAREVLDNNPVRNMRGFGTHNQPVGTWSDDTSLVLATMDAMCAGGLSKGIIMDCFSKWYTEAKYTATGEVFDIGGTTFRAITNYLTGEALERCGEDNEMSNGNGSLMRMLPLVFYTYLNYGVEVRPVAVNAIYELSSLTHAHIISKVCCVYYVYIGIYIMVYGEQKGLQEALREAIEAVEYYYYVEQEEIPCTLEITGLDSLIDCVKMERDEVKSTGYVIDSLVASIWCLYHTYSYREAVELAVNLGGDTDTIGAITGSLAGIHYGYNKIPKEYVKSLKGKKLLSDVCDRFYEQFK